MISAIVTADVAMSSRMIGGPKPSVREIPAHDGVNMWVCGCTVCSCDSYSFALRSDGTVVCEKCRHAVPQLEVHIVPNLKRKS